MNISKLIEEIKENPKKLIKLQEENKLVRIITKGMILGKNIDELTENIVSDFVDTIAISELPALIEATDKAIRLNSSEPLSTEDIMHAQQIAINQHNKDPNVKVTELVKDIKVALATKTHDNEIKDVIKPIRATHLVDFESLGLDPRFKPKRKDFYITSEKDGVFLAVAPGNSKPKGYVIGFAKNKIFFLGHKDGILKEDYTRNHQRIKLLYGILPGGKVIKKLSNKEVICKGTPLEEIPDSLAKEIMQRFSQQTEEIALGAAMSGNDVLCLNGEVQVESMPLNHMLDHLQSRVLITGRTGDGKTVWANMLQRQFMNTQEYLQGGVVSITRDVDNLSNAGNKFTSFSPTWDSDGSICLAFKEKVDLGKRDDFKKITISSETVLPDINKLSKQTIFSMIDNSDCSEQVKIALKRHIEESEDTVAVFEKAKNGELLGEEYTSTQEAALRRLMNSLIPVNYDKIKKVDVKKVLSENKNLGFFIKGLNSDVYGTIIVHELYNIQRDKGVRNPLKEGRVLMIDEVQKYVRFKAFKDIFEMCVLDGRGFGIMLLGVIQSQDQAKKLCSYKDFVLYKAEALDDGKRTMTVDEKTVIIPPLAPEVA